MLGSSRKLGETASIWLTVAKNAFVGWALNSRVRVLSLSPPPQPPGGPKMLACFIASERALCSWGHMTTIFLKIFYIMGYNLKNARNGKSMLPKWQSLRSPASKNEILWWFEFQKNKKICMEIVAGEQGLALQQTVIKSHFFNARGFKLGRFDVFDMLFPFLAFIKLQPIILWKVGHVMA